MKGCSQEQGEELLTGAGVRGYSQEQGCSEEWGDSGVYITPKSTFLVSSACQLHTSVTWKEGLSIERLPRSDLPVAMSAENYLDY